MNSFFWFSRYKLIFEIVILLPSISFQKTFVVFKLDFVFVVNLLIHNLILYSVFKVQMVGLGGLEPPTSRLSGVRSNHLSYKPIKLIV